MVQFLQNLNWQQIISAVVDMLIVAVIVPNLPKILPATKSAFDWLQSQAGHVKNQYAAGILQRVSGLLAAKVMAFENTKIEELKALAAAGKISYAQLPALLKQMKDDLIAEAKADLTAQNLWSAALYVFAGSEDALAKWMNSTVETHVSALPPSGLQTSAAPKEKPAMNAAPDEPVLPPVPQVAVPQP